MVRKKKTQEQTRTQLLAVLAELGERRPEWRFGQLLANVAMAAGRSEANAVWDMEDAEALQAAQDLNRQYADAANTQ